TTKDNAKIAKNGTTQRQVNFLEDGVEGRKDERGEGHFSPVVQAPFALPNNKLTLDDVLSC
ncbi:hypothetical protein Nmel_005452, partial [Mimus melanotis]